MSKIAFMFPGQGSQYVGMGQDFYSEIPSCREVFELAGRASGLDVRGICFEENEKIHMTQYTQIAMLTTEIAILKAVLELGVQPEAAGGLSLGEYGALAAGGVMELDDLFKIIRMRGIFMQEAVPGGGAMTAVLGIDGEAVEKICGETEGMVTVANYNCPGQVVITGAETAVALAGQKLLAAGARKCIPLKVSGPFHSPMLKEAGDKLGEVLRDIVIRDIQIPYLSNVTADYVTDKAAVKDLLIRQVYSPVKWQQSMERMLADGVDTFIEIGPGKTLSGFVKKINREVKVINIEKITDLDKLRAL